MTASTPLRLTLVRPAGVAADAISPEIVDIMAAIHSDPDGRQRAFWVQAMGIEDELVEWTLVAPEQSPIAPPRVGAQPAPARYAMTQRILARADREGVLWTPLIDVLSQRSYFWPWMNATYPSPEDGSVVPLPPVEAWADRAIPAIRAANHDTIVAALQQFRGRAIRERLVREAPMLTPTIVDATLRHPYGDQELLSRPDLTPDLAAYALLAVIARYETVGGTINEESSNVHVHADEQRLFQCFEAYAETHGAYPASVRARLLPAVEPALTVAKNSFGQRPAPVLELAVRDPGLPADDAQRCIAVLVHRPVLVAHIAKHATHPEAVRQAAVRHLLDGGGTSYLKAPAAVLRVGPVTERTLLDVIPALAKEDPSELAQMVHHPSATLTVLRAITEARFDYDGVRDALAANDQARNDPAIRERLLGCRVASVVSILLNDQRPEEFETLWSRLVKADPEMAIDLIERGAIPAGQRIRPSSLAPALAEQDANLSLRVLGILERLEPEPEDVPRQRSGDRSRAR